MMTKKTTKTKTKTQRTKVKSTTLTPLEEKVVRMRHGLRAPDTLELEQVGQDDDVIAEQLRAMEERALTAVSARRSPAKRHIVKALRHKKKK
jgi:DNA-directed RNA polymerase sigma subunit (sigma70/sigma32)